MPKQATKAADNVFYRARMEAAERNDRFSSREGTQDETGIDRTRLARIETGVINPYPEEIVLMSDAYAAPLLMNHYCANICPIGKQQVQPCEMLEFDRMMMSAVAALQDAGQFSREIIQIARDGKISPDEWESMSAVLEYMQNIGKAADEMNLWIKKHMKGAQHGKGS